MSGVKISDHQQSIAPAPSRGPLDTPSSAEGRLLKQMTTIQLYLAPLRGFTDYIYRNTLTRHFDGLDGALAPFIPTVTADRVKPSHFKDILPENNPTLPIVPQIISNQSERFLDLFFKILSRQS